MFHDANEYELRAAECERLAFVTGDLVLREEILSLARAYRGYADHLRGRRSEKGWLKAVNA